MLNNGTHNSSSLVHQNGDRATTDNVSFPSNSDKTELRDINTLLHDAPVIQQARSANSGKLAAAGSEIASAEDFAQAEAQKPFARKVGPKTIMAAVLSGAIILPLGWAFMSGSGSNGSNSDQAVEASEASNDEAGAYVSPEEYAAQQAELEQYRSERAFIDQQVDAEAIDAAGRQRQQSQTTARTTSTTARPATTTAARSTTTSTAQPTAVRVSSPAPPRAATSASRTTVAAVPRPTASVTPSIAKAPEPVDPFERRAQLQELGSYGAPPPMASAEIAQSDVLNPFETENHYIQAISLEPPQTKGEISSAESTPLSAEELQYQQDADAVLSAALPTETDNEAGEENQPVPEVGNDSSTEKAPLAIMPGTRATAELPYGFSWQEGMPLPEVLLLTTEAVMAGEQTVIAAGTQFLGQAQIDPSSGAVTIQVVGAFGETRDIQIPRASVLVQAEDGSVLMAQASGGSANDPNMGGFFMQSLGNGLGNVIGSDDSLVTDIASGVAETLIDNQVERSEANAAARASRAASQPVVWSVDARTVRLMFNNYIPISNAQL
jgi:hypothetical protein